MGVICNFRFVDSSVGPSFIGPSVHQSFRSICRSFVWWTQRLIHLFSEMAQTIWKFIIITIKLLSQINNLNNVFVRTFEFIEFLKSFLIFSKLSLYAFLRSIVCVCQSMSSNRTEKIFHLVRIKILFYEIEITLTKWKKKLISLRKKKTTPSEFHKVRLPYYK